MNKRKLADTIVFSFCGLFAAIGFLLLFIFFWFRNTFGYDVAMDAILFTLFSDLNGTDSTVIRSLLLEGILPAVLCTGILITALLLVPKKLLRKKLCGPLSWPVYKTVSLGCAAVWMLTVFACAGSSIGLFEYYAERENGTKIYEEHYASPDSIQITFPEEKRNLIYIYLESMETTFADKEHGGALDENYIPELTGLAESYVNFSQNETVGGALTPPGTTWTIAATISQTTGAPLTLPGDIWRNGLSNYSQVMPGIQSLGDILKENGYYQVLMLGSDATFAGQRTYYSQHGTDAIYDLHTAREEGILPSDDYHDGFWGYEDHYLFGYAKTKLTELASSDQPFALTMFTIDTHSPSGNPCTHCDRRSTMGMTDQQRKDSRFEDVLSCSSRQVSEFITWLQEQGFYENTTVILTGDHLSMNYAYVKNNVSEEYSRRIYNCIINSPVTPVREKNREFTTLDMFPTTLAALGCTVEGDRLGLGTNLFSDRKTLCEEYGFEYLKTELSRASVYYERNFLYARKSETE